MNPASILYFFPDQPPTGLASWAEHLPAPFNQRFRSGGQKRDNVLGPGGKRGALASWQNNALIEYEPDQQDWKKIGPATWIGIRRTYQPEDFARPNLDSALSVYTVPLGDGKRWRIPVALADAPNFSMPWREEFDESGAIVRRTDPAYNAICRAADQLWDHVSGEGAFQMDEDELRRALAQAIAVNYTIDLTECVALGLFTSDSYPLIVNAILDFPNIDRIVSGKARGPSDTGSGGRDASAGTNLPTPILP